jgi:hypothetical protein
VGYLSAERSKAEHIRTMGKELGALYGALWQQVAWLHQKWEEYVALFGTKPSRVDLMNEVAPLFFRIVEDTLWEGILLHVARLTDAPQSVGKPNLSFRRLAASVDHDETKRKVEELMSEALRSTEFCRDWRNRRIAHRDLRLALEQGADPLQPASREQVAGALKSLSDILNVLSAHYQDSTTIFEFGVQAGGATSLLYAIDAGMKAQTARRQRLKSGGYITDDFHVADL